MKNRQHMLFGLVALFCVGRVLGPETNKPSYAPVVPKEEFSATMAFLRVL